MHYLAPIRDVGALLHVLEIFLVGYYTSLPIVSTQGQFPKLENVGALKTVTLVPPQATCGLPERSIFCHSDRDIKNIHTCTQRLCIQECPYRAVSPAYHDLILLGLGTCVIKDKYDLHPGFTSHSTSFIFYNHKDCLATPPPLTTGVSFTLTVWLKPEHKGVMCVIEKSADGQIVFKLTISEKETVFYYRTVNGLQPPIKVMTQGRFLVKKWIHLSVQVHHTRISFFINGLEEDGTAFDTRNLSNPVSDTVMNSTILLGQSTNGLEQFVGRMQDFRLYQVALTNREIVEVFSKEFPSLHVQSECRCPSSHPRIHPLVQRFCIPNGADDTTKDRVLRLNPDSHALSYVNDNDLGTTWISSLFSTSEIDNNITITIDLENGQYQVFYVILQFYSPLPQALRVQRKKHKDSIWEDWQYFASDCQYFGMDNNGFLQYPDSVNCLQLPKDTPFSRGNVTLSILTPEPNPRPGYNDFYNTQYLQEFVKASQLRIQLFGQYYTEWSELSNVNLRHRYYGVNEITVSGRCNCHGHAHSCDTSLTPYRCLCDKESHTYGDNCDGCLPLFNNKPFRRGDQVNAHNCRSCECNDHSISCHYNVTLDPYPYDHNQGGGGVCDNCLHNTTGKNCELCKDYFYRQVDSNLSTIDVCKPCDCNEAGTIHRSLQCEKIGGQCNCKRHVFGRQCNQCKDGFYNLRQSHSEGCIPCRCNTSGTVNGDITCNQNSGECKCKSNVIGLWCDRCNLGFKQQNMTGKKSCIPCKCHTLGSINQYCNPISGLCKCREDVKGLDCDTCIDNYYGLDSAGCKHCDCDKEGIILGTVCDAVTGQCVCQPNIGGRKCNECLDGYFKVQQNNSVACLPCKCDMSGTIHSSQSCEKSSGQCFCKTGVTGQQCNVCMPHMFNLTVSNHLGCQDCDCHPLGILASTVCDQMNGQCKCLPNYQGRRCNQCMPGFYFSSVHDMRCVSCLCHTTGSRHGICNSTNGQCVCQDSSLTGQRCDQCSDLFFGFDSDIGSCQPCDCNAAGAIKGTCHSTTGQCFCKQFVRGFKCDQCIEDASSLDVRNPYGCSTTPYQQPPPKGSILNSTVIILMWSPPDSPNTNKINYILYRDGLEIYATTDHHPYSPQSYTDTSLLPYTAYFYYVDAKNVHGFASSTTVMYRTKAGAPIGDIYLNHISPAGPYSASLNWTITSNESGPIEKFRLINTSTDSPQPNVFYEGPETLVTVHNLAPFKKYNFSVQACTIEGCLQSLPVTVVTGQAPPAFQNPPVMQNSSSTDLHLQWFPPFQANGIIIRYELYMRGVAWSDGNHIAPERRVFHASGWLNPQPVVESQNENALMPPQTSATVSNLEPNTEYEFCIVTTNMAGITASEWVTMITAESAPVFMPPPSVFPLSSQSLNVSWERANNSFARGKIIGYTINAITEHMPDESHTEATSEVLYVAEDHELFYILTGLKTYHAYTFTITLCNTVGCVTSKPGTGQTLAAAPEKINAPLVNGIDSTVMKITWVAPLDPNGPSPMYQIERIEPSLTIPSKTDFVKGTRFPGNGYFKFPTSTFPVNTYFTVPQSVSTPLRVLSINGYSAEVTWTRPAGVRGVIEKYILKAYAENRPNIPTISDAFSYTSKVTGSLKGLLPFTKYAVTLSICTLAGCTESSHTLNISTLQEAPGDVQMPMAESFPNWLHVYWSSPKKPNGIITQYILYLNGSQIYIGNETEYNVSALATFTPHQFLLTACTVVGCTNSSQVTLLTAQLPPDYVFPPILTVLDSTSIYVQWKEPKAINGILERYILLITSNLKNIQSWNVIYNSNELFLDYTIRKLFPGTKYFIKISACTEGGCTTSDISSATTEESSPEGVQTPKIQSYSPDSFNISWSKPERPNGIITGYGLYMNGILMQNSSHLSYFVDELSPWSKHLFRLQACTAKGCALGPMVEAHTQESKPEGKVLLHATTEGPSGVRVKWQGPEKPNGQITYTVIFDGLFYEKKDSVKPVGPNSWVQPFGLNFWNQLEKFFQYMEHFNFIQHMFSIVFSALIHPCFSTAPDGVLPPRLSSATPTSLQVVWSTPVRNNAPGLPSYRLQMRPMNFTNEIIDLFAGPTASLTYTVKDLQPFTTYELRVIASNRYGDTNSNWISMSTEQDRVDTRRSRSCMLEARTRVTWKIPLIPNGDILSYEIRMPDPQIAIINTTLLSHTVTNLIPYTNYSVTIVACSGGGIYLGGCTESLPTYVTTHPTLPQGISPLSVTPISETFIAISWQPPSRLNGPHLRYELLRRKILQPLASNPPEDLNRWQNIYSGTQWFYEDKGKCLFVFEPICFWPKPEGIFPPEVFVINSTAVRVIWTSPSNPNGVVTQYSVYVNNKLYKTEMKFPEPLILGELFPFTVYSIQVEACTVYACVTSNSTQITTIEGMPSRISSPNISSIHSRSVQIDWASPEEPNGIILGYDLRRKTLHSCAFVQKLTGYQSGKSCLLIRCRIYENICGDLCYHPDNQVCCDGVLHNRKDGYQCCEDKYTSSSRNSSGICCGGQMNVVQPEYQCCGGYYTRVQAGNICCYNKPMNSVSIGDGDSCCGGIPFLTSGNQICCGETLHDSFNQQCCGGKIIGQHFICCGDKEKGMLCCGTEYVNISESTCCSASSGECKVHLTPDNRVPLKCCETELIPEKEECCNGVGYIPMSHVCSDKGEECLSPVLCPISLSAAAYCGRCDFNPATESCFWTKRPINSTTNMTEGGDGICSTEEQIIYIGGKNKYTFTDTYLDPFTTYEYRVSAWNSFGQGFSNTSRVTTKQDKPQGVSPPRWAKVDNYEDTIFLNWKEPDKANGIVHYVVLRDRMERFRGRDQHFTDKGRILPFGEYTYQLRACTMAGCTESAKVVAAINQGVPEKVSPPVITTVNSTALHLSWTTPTKPNGSIREYQIHEANKGLIYVSASGRMQYTYTGLQPYKNYSFLLTACTSAGCTSSKPSSSQTLQDAPQGVWSKPCHVIINATALELYWREPEKPNGIISQYRLIRNKAVISTISGEYLSFTDVGLQPNSRYFYQLEASTVAGSNTSDIYVIQTPVATPEEIHDPYNITVIGPYSIFIAWDIPGVFNSSMPLEFNVFFHAGSNDSQVYSAGMDHFILVEDLKPYIQYDIRIQACQNGRLASKQENMLVFIWSEGILEYIDSSNDLQHYTAYEYRVTAHNAKGSMESVWSLIHTLEAAPQDMEPPNAQAMSAYSVIVKWTQPANPNGPITHYRVICQESPSDPTLSISAKTALTVLGTSHQANVFGLLPFTTYQICIEVFNNAGNVSSPGTSVQTLEASPSGLSNFTVETKDNGTALLLEWTAPIRTNGVIQVYNILSDGNLEYSGLSHQFLVRRLEPYTVYTLVLEACTAAGCTRTLPQLVQTDEAPPASQLPSIIQFLNATHIELSWPPPIHPNGKIKHYNVIKRDTQGNVSGNRKTINEKVVFTESNTESNIFIYIDEGLHPWTNYEYKIRAWNSAGYTDSAWTVVQTSQAAPNSLQPPKLFHDENSPHQLLIQWAHPEEENGIILSYRLKKNHILFPFSFDAATFSYTDENVLAYSVYSYAVIACTLGGCTTSDPTTIRTLEAPPAVVNPPTIESVSSTEVNVTWTPPLIQNGDITKYIIQLDNEKYFVGKQLSKLISNLQPFTLYVIRLVACTNGGCNSSLPASVRTMEAPPSDIKAPSFKVTGAESIEITWQIPEKPNGEIRSYELRRDQHLIFVGSNTHYHDFALTPGMEYSYTISANNSQGSTTSPPAKIKTHSASPSGMGPPKMQAKSANEILVTWNPPSKTNGDIINYTLSIHYPVEMEINRYNFNNSFTSLMSLSFIIKELKPYHWYEAKVGACTLQGCASSEWATGHTLEAPPESQPPPLIDLQKNQQETHLVPLMIWNSPQHPNGKIIRYELYRRQVTELQEVAVTELVYNGSSTSFKDVNVLSYTEYEYQIWSVNSAGRTPSTWTYCRTGPAPPEGIHTPTFHTVSSTLAVANITPPTKPNGIVSLYRLFSTNNNGTDTVLAEGTSNMQTIYGLKPFTNYSVGVEVCTCMKCCRRGHVVQLTTQPAPPSHQAPPRKTYITSRAASFHWDKPRSPNGIIQSYEVHMQTTCTQPMQIVVTSCAPGSPEVKYTGKEESCNVTDLQPYTNYSLRVVSYNSVGSTASDWISFITQKEKPVYKANFHVTSNLTAIFLDWSLSFLLNGHLKEYVLTDRGQRLYSGFDSNVYIQRTTAKTPVHPFPSAKNGTEARGKTFYTELWFIILMAFLGLLLLAVFLSLLLQKKLSKQPYVRERPPLSPLQQRMSPASGYLQNDTSVGLSDTKNPGLESHSSHNMSVVRKTSKVSHSFSQNSLYRSASQLLTTHDKKSLVDSSIWDSVIQGHDSGMCVDDEDLISTIKCFSTVTKQNTAFTDTPL
ncbi:hypothetical protein FKM82_010212 [Ascaphus truei]